MSHRTTIPLVLALASSVASGQGAPPGPQLPDYALTNVRIVTAPGRVIDRGTVLLRDGRIAAVGATVTIPAGAVRLDLAGHTVFPGLIDAATSTGLPATNRQPAGAPDPAPAAGRGGRGGGGPDPAAGRGGGGRGSAPPPPVIYPELDASAEAADMFSPSADDLANMRAGGVTTVGLVFQGGLFPGRVGVALTGGRDESHLALRSAVGQTIAFGTNRNGYPGTGIGAVAFVRQSILDAQYENRLDKAMKAGTPGARPSNDVFRRALMPLAANEMPGWFVASSERQINRVGDIVKEMGLKGPVIVGAQEGWRVASLLKAQGATAVVSLQWPNSVTGAAFTTAAVGGGGAGGGGAPAPGGNTTELRANASALVKAGVPVVLASYGGESGAAFRDRVRSTIEAGMSADDALRATTIAPATLLGVQGAVGTIEAGKLANLVVVNGNDLFASGSPIRHVFVEGRLYTPAGAATTPQRGGLPF